MAKRENKAEGVNELPDLELGVNGIKGLFKAGAVPREADYAKLIEYVHYLHKLLGVEGVDGSSGPGLGGGLINEADSVLSVDGSVLAGTGLNHSGSVINVGQGPGITVVADAVSLAEDSWEFIFAKLYGATHWVFSEHAVVYLRRLNSEYVVARGISKNDYVFSLTMNKFTWKLHVPQEDLSSVDRGCFTLVYRDESDDVSGLFGIAFHNGIEDYRYSTFIADFKYPR